MTTEIQSPHELQDQSGSLLFERLLSAAMVISQVGPCWDDRGYLARALVLATLPHRRVLGTTFTRSSGRATLSIYTREGRLLPYGVYPRLFLTYACSQAVKLKTPDIDLGPSYSAFLRQIALGNDGKTMKRFREQIRRLTHCTMDVEVLDPTLHLEEMVGVKPFKRSRLFWDPEHPSQPSLYGSNMVRLSDDFYNQIVASKVPLDLRVVAAIKQSALALDIYAWASYVVGRLDDPRMVPWRALRFQFGSNYNRARDFKAAFVETMKAVQVVYPFKAAPDEAGLTIYPGKSSISRR